jgi:RNA polymerase sigma-70 factor (ECF subfamily)
MFHFSVKLETGGEATLEALMDSELLRRKQGTLKLNQKITQMYELWRDSVYRYLVLATGNYAEAEEITQEAFLQLFRCLLGGQDIRNARAWIFRVAHNFAINRRASEKYLVAMDAASWERLCVLHRDPGLDPEQSVLEEEYQQRLKTAFKLLPAQQQQCLLLRAEGFRYEQISGILGISPSNVAQSLHRGIKKLMRDHYE